MSQKYKEKQPTGKEYVDATTMFCNYTYAKCMQLPQKWMPLVLEPMLRLADDIETQVRMANKVYINENTMDPANLSIAYNKRISLLSEALRLFSAYDIKYDRLMGLIDIPGQEKNRLKNLIINIITEERRINPDIKDLKIEIVSRSNEYEFISASGSKNVKIKLTAKNREYWLRLQADAITKIRTRITNDKKAINRLQNQQPNAQGQTFS